MNNQESLQSSDKDIPVTALYDSKANKIIRNFSLAASGAGIIPNSFISGALVTGIQVLLIRELCQLYHVPFSNRKINVIVNSAIGSAVSRLVTVVTTNLTGVNEPMKGLTGGTIAGLYTATAGDFYKVHFQSGGRLEDASIGDLSRYFVEEYNSGDFSLNDMTNPATILKRVLDN